MPTMPSHQHRAVADGADLAFVLDHLRRGAAGDERMEAADRPAHDADEDEREDAPRRMSARRSTKTSLSGGACSGGLATITLTIEQYHRADLEEAGEVIARPEQQPDRQHRGDEAVDDEREDRLIAVEREVAFERRAGNPAAGHCGEEYEHAADDRRFNDAPGTNAVHP